MSTSSNHPLSPEQLCQFGVLPEDEQTHPFSEDHNDWNESYFFDWYNEDGTEAGHARIGWHPVQKRVLFWLHVFHNNEWFLIEENRIPFEALALNQGKQAFAYDGWGLNFHYTTDSELLSGTFELSGFARCIDGTRNGIIVPIELSLDVQAIGPAYSRGGGTVEGHSAKGFSTNRYEQPHISQLKQTIDNSNIDIEVRGERDHSWGPRPWDMSWQFFALNCTEFSIFATQVDLPDWPEIKMGYIKPHDSVMEDWSDIQFNISFDDQQPNNRVSGSIHFRTDSGLEKTATLETISGTEIDITHAFNPPKRTPYSRSLVRCTFDDGKIAIGWLESNRMESE